jgi:hypothetical protein
MLTFLLVRTSLPKVTELGGGDGRVAPSVEVTSPGSAEVDQERIFERFVRGLHLNDPNRLRINGADHSGIRKSTARGHRGGDALILASGCSGTMSGKSIDWRGAGRRADHDRG